MVSSAINDGAGLTVAGTLRICLLGDAGIWLGEDRLVFLTHRAELAVFCLALTGRAGLHREVLVERLWPGAPADRGRQRLRTLLWQARMALGSEAWRLARRQQTVRLDITGAVVDLVAARRRAVELLGEHRSATHRGIEEIVAELSQPLLLSWQYQAWVEVEAETDLALVARLRRLQQGL